MLHGATHIRRTRTLLQVVLALCLLLNAAVQAALSAAPPDVTGAYEVIVKGAVTGNGTIAVGAKSVTINLKVTNGAGESGHLIAANVKMENGRFAGTGTVFGKAMSISGRIDPAESQGQPRAACIQATFSAGEDLGGRIVGFRRGAGP